MKKPDNKIIFLLIIGLTGISTVSGFSCYMDLLNIEKAVLIVLVLECIRITTIWSFIHSTWIKIIAIPVYVSVAVTCGMINWVSLTSEVIESYQQAGRDTELYLDERIDRIKAEQIKRIDAEVKDLDEKIDFCMKKIAYDPELTYYENRLAQRRFQKEKLIEKRISVLKEMPPDKVSYIRQQSASLQMEFDTLSVKYNRRNATSLALIQITGMEISYARKLIIFILIVTIELSIILLSLVAKGANRLKIRGNTRLEKTKPGYNDEELSKFLEKCNEILKKQGRLPYTRELGKKQRDLRRQLMK